MRGGRGQRGTVAAGVVGAAVLLACGLASAGCRSRKAPPQASSSASASPWAQPSDFPPAARRTTPPPGLEAHALALGAVAPPFTLPSTTGGSFSLQAALTQGAAVLVFYRGHW